MNIFSVSAILAAIYLVFQLVSNYFQRRQLIQLKIKNDAAQQAYENNVIGLTKEIQDAKLKYNSDKSKFDDSTKNLQ